MTIILTLTTAGIDTTAFNLYSNADSYTAIQDTATRAELMAGKTVTMPAGTTAIKCVATGECSSELFVSVINKLAPSGSISGGDLLTCVNTSNILTANVVYQGTPSYLWSPGGATTQNLTVNSPGTYSVQVTDSYNNKTSTITKIVSENVIAPSVNIVETGSLPGSVTLSASGSTAQGSKTYLWSTGETSANIIVNGPGVYDVTVTGGLNGCTANQSIQVLDCSMIGTIEDVTPECEMEGNAEEV